MFTLNKSFPLVASLAALVMPTMVHAADIYVTTTSDVIDGGDGLISLREAISQANTNAGLSMTTTIHLSAGTYKIGIPGADEQNNASGDFDFSGELGSTTIIRGAGAGATIIDGDQLDRIMEIKGGGYNVILERLTIRNGRVVGASAVSPSANGSAANGGGILVSNSGDLTLRDVIVEDCSVQGGAGAAGADAIGSGIQSAGNGGVGGKASGGGLAITNAYSGQIFTFERVGFYRNVVQGGVGANGGNADSTDNNATGGVAGNGGHAIGAGLFAYITNGVNFEFRQVQLQENEATGGAGGNGGYGETDAASGGDGKYGGSGGVGAGGALSIWGLVEGGTISFTDISVLNNQATVGVGGIGGYSQNQAAADGSISGVEGGFGGRVDGAGINLEQTGPVHVYSGEISNNIATGGAGGSGGQKAAPGAALMNGGNGRIGGAAQGAGFSAGGDGPTTFHIQFDSALKVNNNQCQGGAGGNGIAPANGGTIGVGGLGNSGGFPGLDVRAATSVSTTGGGPQFSGNSALGGMGGESGGGVDASSGIPDATAFAYDPAFTFHDVSGKAFADTNADGLSTGESGLAGVALTLKDAGSQTVVDMSTAADGTYAFSTTWEAASTLQFTTPNFSGIPTTQNVGGDDTIDSDVAADGTLAVTITSNLTNVDAGYDDPGPITGTFTLTISGKVSADVSKVSIGSTIVTPTNGTYTISVDVPASAGYVDLVTTSNSGAQTKRRIKFDNAAIPSI